MISSVVGTLYFVCGFNHVCYGLPLTYVGVRELSINRIRLTHMPTHGIGGPTCYDPNIYSLPLHGLDVGNKTP